MFLSFRQIFLILTVSKVECVLPLAFILPIEDIGSVLRGIDIIVS